MNLTGYWAGEFNVKNEESGKINNLTTQHKGDKAGSSFNIENDGTIFNANLNATKGDNVLFDNKDGAVGNLNAFADMFSKLKIDS
jgi:hypothetical protein